MVWMYVGFQICKSTLAMQVLGCIAWFIVGERCLLGILLCVVDYDYDYGFVFSVILMDCLLEFGLLGVQMMFLPILMIWLCQGNKI